MPICLCPLHPFPGKEKGREVENAEKEKRKMNERRYGGRQGKMRNGEQNENEGN